MSTFGRSILILLILGLAPRSTQAQTVWYVDDDCTSPGAGTGADPFCTIQGGVNASSDGDIVLVAPGTYTGDGNRDITLSGKKIWVKSTDGPSATTLDIQGSPSCIHRGFFLTNGETRETVIEGFTLSNGYLIGNTGGSENGGGGAGIYVRNSSPTIRNCVVRDNISATFGNPFIGDGRGGGVLIDGGSSALLEGCTVANNYSGRGGGGINVGFASNGVEVRNCLIINNTSAGGFGGGGISNSFSQTSVVNTSIIGNSAETSFGGGVRNEQGELRLSNCIVAANEGIVGPQILVQGPIVIIEYSNVEGGLADIYGFSNPVLVWGPGNIDADPLFVDPDNDDFRLLPGSPCIDAGNNLAVPGGLESDLDGFARFVDDLNTPDTGNPAWGVGIVDMGAYEFGGEDCNNNGIADVQEVADGATDCDANNVPDECQPDCNENGQADNCEVIKNDCDGNGRMDQCDPDCNGNTQPDACDLADGASDDCNFNLVPDECEEFPWIIGSHPTDQEGAPGEWVMFAVEAEIFLPAYQWRKDGEDLQDDGRIIGSESATLFIFDIQASDAGEYDCVVTDTATGCFAISDPATLSVLSTCPADVNDDGVVGPVDLAMLLAAWGPCPDPDTCPADLNADGVVGPFDLAQLLGAWGDCP